MNRAALLSAVLAAALSLTVGRADASTVLTFDDVDNGTVLTNQYAGVTFSNAKVVTHPSAGSVPNVLQSISDGFRPKQGNPIMAIFAQAVSFVALTGHDVGDNGLILKAYDAVTGGNLVTFASYAGSGAGTGVAQTLSVSGLGILRVEFSQLASNSPEGSSVDDFTYTVAPVPLPATLPLGLGAVAALGLFGRRRKQA